MRLMHYSYETRTQRANRDPLGTGEEGGKGPLGPQEDYHKDDVSIQDREDEPGYQNHPVWRQHVCKRHLA